ncbi:M24 family metallopeptidase, partial [Erysipelotrichaceae bacterium OttesenSCG-928-M19]|nr:M24 family metallopeptidase [Erysipelotrichaceae bacterium OttesenSCG-928-M19]
NIDDLVITELSAIKKIEELRKEQENYLSPAFSTISAYKEHAAMMHYSVTPESNYQLKAKGMYLIDTGANYLEGTTDFTRTIILGEIPLEMKKHYTAVVKGMLNLSNAKFLEGTKAYNLDIIARMPIWQLGLDYLSATGHGIGYLTNVHEPPLRVHWQANLGSKLEVGTLLSNEPGIYIENSHGIRIENDLLIQNSIKNEYGQFLEFEVCTFVPIDLDGIDINSMSSQDKEYLNSYHKLVRDKLSKYLNEAEVEWLVEYTKEI